MATKKKTMKKSAKKAQPKLRGRTKKVSDAFEARFGIKPKIPAKYVRPTVEAVEAALKAQAEYIRAEVAKRSAVERMVEEKKGPAWSLLQRLVRALDVAVKVSDKLILHKFPGELEAEMSDLLTTDNGRISDFEELLKEAKAFMNGGGVG